MPIMFVSASRTESYDRLGAVGLAFRVDMAPV
jgi:hypothetical protein